MNDILPIDELEKRMRPGAYSHGGFLGFHESLDAVISQDTKILEMLGVTFEQIADALEYILSDASKQGNAWLFKGLPKSGTNKYEIEIENRHRYVSSLIVPDSIPRYSLDNLPDIDKGNMVGDKVQVFIAYYLGPQHCPWSCNTSNWSNIDFLILNRQSGKYFTGPGLIIHLIRKHHFFEGVESPYRVNPAKVVDVLGLSPIPGEQMPTNYQV
jgi:hypothetical protein